MTKISDIARIDRPREKLIKYGPARLSEAELLAIILRTGRKGENAVELAAGFLKRYAGVLAGLSYEDIKYFPGLGTAKACGIIACFELGRRVLKDKAPLVCLKPEDVYNGLKDIRNCRKEHFIAFYLDSRNQEIHREIISIGTLNASLVHPREVFEPAVKHLAANIILAHNHPSGDCLASEEDLAVNKRLVEAGRIFGIEVLDHVIVTENAYMSFKEKGLF